MLSVINLFSAPLLNLVKSVETATEFEIVSNSWAASDDDSKLLDIGFTFPFNNSNYTQVWVNSNGMLSFSSSTSTYSNKNIPYSAEPQSVYPYWDDLYRRGSSSITYGKLGTGASSRFIVSWNDVPHYPNNGRYKFQVVFYANGSIRFRYDSTSNTDGSSATIGVQENTTNYDRHSYNSTAVFDSSKDILYSVATANLNLKKESCVISDPINNTSNPKRIPNATIRYAFEIRNSGGANADNVLVKDNIGNEFDETTITNLKIDPHNSCNCLTPVTVEENGANGGVSGKTLTLDFDSMNASSVECGYFEVQLK